MWRKKKNPILYTSFEIKSKQFIAQISHIQNQQKYEFVFPPQFCLETLIAISVLIATQAVHKGDCFRHFGKVW